MTAPVDFTCKRLAACAVVVLLWCAACNPAAAKENAGDASPTDCASYTAFLDQETDLMGYVDAANATALPAQFPMAMDFNEFGVAFAVAGDRWALIDCAGTVLLHPHVVDNGPDFFSEGLARFVDGDKYGFFTPAGRVAIPARFDYAEPFEDGAARVCEGCEFIKDGEYTRVTGGDWWRVDAEGNAIREK